MRKEIERLEEDSNRTTLDLQRLREESGTEKLKLYKDIEDLKGAHKEEKDRLNQQIVDLIEQLKNVEPISEENRSLQEKVKELEDSLKRNNADYELKLTLIQEQAEIEKERALLTKERELREQFFQQNREDTKELYTKIEKLQAENNKLQLEISSFKRK